MQPESRRAPIWLAEPYQLPGKSGHLGHDIRRSFVRRGVGDERCMMAETGRMLRVAADKLLRKPRLPMRRPCTSPGT